MKEIFYYKRYNDLLLSMDSIEDNAQDRKFLLNLFYNFSCDSSHVICISRRLNNEYNIENIIHNVIEKDVNIKNVKTKRDYEFVSFYLDFSENIKSTFLKLFTTFWFSYEQPSFIFIKEKQKKKT